MPAPLAAAKLAWQAAGAAKQAQGRGRGPIVAMGGVALLVVLCLAALGGGVATLVARCGDESGPVDVGPVSAKAKADIPTKKTGPTIVTLSTLVRLSNKLDIDWHFVASIAAQECDFGRCSTANQVNSSGCVGPMQLGVGGRCGDFFGAYKTEGDDPADGNINPRDPEDAVATAITGLKEGKGAPGRGGSYAQYRKAACGYYGACADANVNYADEVMARAVAYGFKGSGAPSASNLDEQAAANAAPAPVAAPERTLLNLGDSLAQGVEQPLERKLPDWRVKSDAVRSRPTAAGVTSLSERDPGSLPTVFAVSLGSNDSPRSTSQFRRHVERVLEVAGPQRCVLWLTIRRPAQGGVSYEAMNRVLSTAERGASNMRVIDSSTISGLAGDGVHYTPAGYRARADKIALAAEECISALAPPAQGAGEGCPEEGGAISAGGAAELRKVVTLRSPREFKPLPRDIIAPGFQPFMSVDARVWPNVVYLSRKYGMKVTAGREPGHSTHGDGTAIDAVPSNGSSQAVWDASTGRVAKDLGWTPGCARSGVAPVCPFVPAIHGIFYDGYPNHGSPKACQGGCSQHIHISWESDTYGAYPGGVGPPPGFVKVFPVPKQSEDGILG